MTSRSAGIAMEAGTTTGPSTEVVEKIERAPVGARLYFFNPQDTSPKALDANLFPLPLFR